MLKDVLSGFFSGAGTVIFVVAAFLLVVGLFG
jgi:hypothetical protein